MSRSQFHRAVYVVLLCLLAVGMTTSVFATNLLWFLLLVNWVVEWNWREKFANFRTNYLLHAFLAMTAVHLLWLVGTANMDYALFDLQKKMPLIAIPLVVLTSRPLDSKELQNVGIAYVAAVFIVSVIGFARYMTIPYLPYRSIVPYISHIRFALNVCMTLVLLSYAALKYRRAWLYALNLLLSVWFLLFLFLLHSYTGFVILLATVPVLLICYGRRLQRRVSTMMVIAYCAIVLTLAGLVGGYAVDYYRLKPLSTEPLRANTVNGNPYTHGNGLVENGNYVHNYVCREEMCKEWARISEIPIDSVTAVGYSVYPALLRYLNGMGVTKDSLGMTHLTPTDIQAIERGVANPIYQQHGLRKMLYVLFFEYENYRCYHSVSNSSMLQRIELWRNGWKLFLQHPLWGVGTGDVVDQCHALLGESGSQLANTQLHIHNQYLNFLLAFGLAGFGLISFFFIRVIALGFKVSHGAGGLTEVLFVAFLCILFISFISEDTLETLAGITIAALGFSLLCPRPSSINRQE